MAHDAIMTYRIGLLPGDGIGKDVITEARKVVETAASSFGFSVEWRKFPYGAEHYLNTGEILPDEALEEMQQCCALLQGAIGDPRVPPGVLERGILLKTRFHFDQYVNLRPASTYPNVPTPLKRGEDMDIVVVRENTEDLYVGLGFLSNEEIEATVDMKRPSYKLKGALSLKVDASMKFAAQLALATEMGVRRITRYACNLARRRKASEIVLATKSNAVKELYGFWEEIAKEETSKEGISLKLVNVDALCYQLVRDPSGYGVILCPNLFGDIVSDLLAGLTGGLGLSPSANIGDGLSMFEPVHGSAPDIAGTGRANPLAAILSAGLMLEHLAQVEASEAVKNAVLEYLRAFPRQRHPIELGGEATTSEVGDTVASIIQRM